MSNQEAIKILLGLLKKYKKKIAIIAVCLLASTGLNMLLPILSKNIMDKGFLGKDKTLLMQLILASAILYGCIKLIDICKEAIRIQIVADLEYSLSEQSFVHLLQMKPNYFKQKNDAEILNTLSTDIANITSIADESMFFVIAQIFGIVGGVIGLFLINYKLTLLVMLFIPFKYLAIKYFAKKRKVYMDSYMKDSESYAKWFGETITGMQEIKLFHLYSPKKEEFYNRQKDVINRKKQMNILSQLNLISDGMMIQLLQTILYIVGANMLFDLQLSLGSIFAFITYSTYVTAPISAILNIGYLLSGIIPSTKRYFAFMELEQEKEGGSVKALKAGEITLKQVSFSYQKGYKVLNHINWVIPHKGKVVLVGKNGSGKSTLINLLTRFYEVEEGEILLNGRNIQDFEINHYRSLFAVVSQQVYLFHDTIRNNICLYKKVDEITLQNAIADSGLEEFINEVSLDYMVGENGSLLSGGQRQKIAMARALIYDKPIFILDEATSNMDRYTDKQINQLIHTRLKDKTVILVTHKQETINEIETVVFLDQGKLKEIANEEIVNK